MCDLKDAYTTVRGWLRKNKMTELFTVRSVPCGPETQFECELTVNELGYTTMGRSTSRKEAMRIACVEFLSRVVPVDSKKSSETPEHSREEHASHKSCVGDVGSKPGRSTETNNVSAVSRTETDTLPRWFKPIPHLGCYSYSNMQMDAEAHGGWTGENYKERWTLFLNENKAHTEICSTATGREKEGSYLAEVTLTLDHLYSGVRGYGVGFTNLLAVDAACASCVRQLYHMGLVENRKDFVNCNVFATAPVYAVDISSDILDAIDEYLQSKNITYAEPDENCLLPSTVSEMKPDIELNIRWPSTSSLISSNMVPNVLMQPVDFLPTEVNPQQALNTSLKKLPGPLDDFRKSLPIYERRDEVLRTVRQNRVSVVVGETGSGKTTQICQYLLEDHLTNEGQDGFYCIVIQPRRISTISLANRVAKERGESLGESVGYSVRYESVMPKKRDAILFCTTGVLMRRFENGLSGVSHMIVDEVHDRNVETDIILAFLREAVFSRPNFRVILMSATADVQMFQDYFKSCPVVKISGRSYPVKTYFLEDALAHVESLNSPGKARKRGQNDAAMSSEEGSADVPCEQDTVRMREVIARLENEETNCQLVKDLIFYQVERGLRGSVLVFLDGWNSISTFYINLKQWMFHRLVTFEVLRLHSRLPKEEQFRVFHKYPPDVIKIILATNIAESSITIDDAVLVIDSCRVKVNVFAAEAAIQEYITDWASQSSLKQRRGRAGRIQPGVCYHLCSKARYEKLPPYPRPAILMTPLHLLLPRIMTLDSGNVYDFFARTIDPPPIERIAIAQHVLYDLGILNHKCELTPLGIMVARLPVSPVLAKALIIGSMFGYGDLMCIFVACIDSSEALNYGDFLMDESQQSSTSARSSDFVKIMEMYQEWLRANRRGRRSALLYCQHYGLSHAALTSVSRAVEDLKATLRSCGFPYKCLRPQQIFSGTREWDLMSSFLTMVFTSNLCCRESGRWVITCDGHMAKIGAPSVVLADLKDWREHTFFFFNEKILTNHFVRCSFLTEITATQLLLFGSRTVTSTGTIVNVDNWLRLIMSPGSAAKILAVRVAIDRYVKSSIDTDGRAVRNLPRDLKLLRLLFKLSSYGLYEIVETTKIKAPIIRNPEQFYIQHSRETEMDDAASEKFLSQDGDSTPDSQTDFDPEVLKNPVE